MCGIFLIYSTAETKQRLFSLYANFESSLSRRGPNGLQTYFYEWQSPSGITFSILAAASVLWLRGSEPFSQPLQSDDYIFMYNGDIFDGPADISDPKFCDTSVFLKSYLIRPVLHSLSNNVGPFSFIFFDKHTGALQFGRDRFGRRSLLFGKIGSCEIISSVGPNERLDVQLMEVPATGIFTKNLSNGSWYVEPLAVLSDISNGKLAVMEQLIAQHIAIKNNRTTTATYTHKCIDMEDVILYDIEESNVLKQWSTLFEKELIDLERRLLESVRKRVQMQPSNCIKCTKNCNHVRTGILFSGGVDCTILALMVHHCETEDRPIDLINVAFIKNNNNFETPDRLTARQSFEELKKLAPSRMWNLMFVNVQEEDLHTSREEHIDSLIKPLHTVIDDDLGCALWFAASAPSICRILISGAGADELFGGYSRHKMALIHQGWEGLHMALEHDWYNLPYRNLARDDRVVADHGKQLRLPYLDEHFVTFVRSLACWKRSCPSKYKYGDKILLRALAYRLSLEQAALLKKRAMQFGCRIANSKSKAHEICARLCP